LFANEKQATPETPLEILGTCVALLQISDVNAIGLDHSGDSTIAISILQRVGFMEIRAFEMKSQMWKKFDQLEAGITDKVSILISQIYQLNCKLP
jgi:hypothetical protein